MRRNSTDGKGIYGRVVSAWASINFFSLTMKRLLIVLTMLFIPCIIYAAQTTGGVNWIDPLQYTKPAFYPITVPDEATCPNKYYVNLSGGSGSTCSHASPCALSGLSGKPGLSGGPAYIYIKGTGRLTGSFYGSSGNEVVIKPWPDDSNVVTFNAVGTNGPSEVLGSYVIIDGGSNLQFDFVGPSNCTDQNTCWTTRINGSHTTWARSRIRAHNSYGVLMGIAQYVTGLTDVHVINNEFYDSNNISNETSNAGVYLGQCPCSGGCSSYTNVYILNNIFRDIATEGIESNARANSSGLLIDGNAFHNIGKVSCGYGSWYCRPAVTAGASCGGTISDVTISNNIMWDIGAGAIWFDADSNQRAYNNTIYQYGIGTGSYIYPNRKYGINSYSSSYTGTVVNNIVYSNTGIDPFYNSGRWTATNNLCASGESCGTSSKTYSSSTFLSTDQNNPSFLKIGSSSPAIDAGVNDGVGASYNGTSRPYGSGYDIGAFEYGVSPSAPVLAIQ